MTNQITKIEDLSPALVGNLFGKDKEGKIITGNGFTMSKKFYPEILILSDKNKKHFADLTGVSIAHIGTTLFIRSSSKNMPEDIHTSLNMTILKVQPGGVMWHENQLVRQESRFFTKDELEELKRKYYDSSKDAENQSAPYNFLRVVGMFDVPYRTYSNEVYPVAFFDIKGGAFGDWNDQVVEPLNNLIANSPEMKRMNIMDYAGCPTVFFEIEVGAEQRTEKSKKTNQMVTFNRFKMTPKLHGYNDMTKYYEAWKKAQDYDFILNRDLKDQEVIAESDPTVEDAQIVSTTSSAVEGEVITEGITNNKPRKSKQDKQESSRLLRSNEELDKLDLGQLIDRVANHAEEIKVDSDELQEEIAQKYHLKSFDDVTEEILRDYLFNNDELPF